MESRSPTPQGAQCASHGDRPAVKTCPRCGNFMCGDCALAGPECPSCVRLAGGEVFPFSRHDFDFGRLWDFCFEKFQEQWVLLSVCILVLGVGSFVGSMAGSLLGQVFGLIAQVASDKNSTLIIAATGLGQVVSSVLGSLMQGVLQLGLVRAYIELLHGKKLDVGRMFSQLPKFMKSFAVTVLTGLLVFVPMIAAIAPLVFFIFQSLGDPADLIRNPEQLFDLTAFWLLLPVTFAVALVASFVALQFSFAPNEIAWTDCSPMEALRRSWLLTEDHRLTVFGYAFAVGLLDFVGVLACCVGAIPAAALGQLLILALYVSLRRGSGLPAPVEA